MVPFFWDTEVAISSLNILMGILVSICMCLGDGQSFQRFYTAIDIKALP